MRTLLITLLAILSLTSARGEAPQKTIDELLQKIRAELPKGWTAAYDAKIPWLEVSREREVLAVSALPNSPANPEPKPRKYVFAFRVMPAVPPAEYRQLRAENTKTQKELTVLYDDLSKMNIAHKFDSFLPGTAREKEAVARYEALKKKLHALPDFYFEDIGLTWALGEPELPEISVTDEKVRAECQGVQEKVLKLLSKYKVD
jgi:hypothetical protein